MIVLDTNVISELMGLDSCSFCYHDSNGDLGGKNGADFGSQPGRPAQNRLQRRAKRHGHSMEAEARDILRNALREDKAQPVGFGTASAALFSGQGIFLDEPIAELRDIRLQIPDFES
jgi:plasmid stability protein